VNPAAQVEVPIAGVHARDIVDLARGRPMLVLSDAARRMVDASALHVSNMASSGRAVYGVNTRTGALAAGAAATPAAVRATQRDYVRHYAVGVGPPVADDVVRSAMLLRINTLAQGRSGVRAELIDALIRLFNAGATPVVPRWGSVGASGDLVPLSHLMLPLLGEGRLRWPGSSSPVSGRTALRRLGLRPLRPGPKEGVALLNGHAFSLALACVAAGDAAVLLEAADAAVALSLLALGGHEDAYSPLFSRAGWSASAALSAGRVRSWLAGSAGLNEATRFGPHDPYSLRAAPRVHGAIGDLVIDVVRVLDAECNVISDNPILLDDERFFSGAMFHAEDVALRLDSLCIALSVLAETSLWRQSLLVDDGHNGGRLPAGLMGPGEGASRVIPLNILSGALVARTRELATPSSTTSVPLEAGLQDIVSMAANAGSKALESVGHALIVVACEMVTASVAIHLALRTPGPDLATLVAFAEPARLRGALAADVIRVAGELRAGRMPRPSEGQR
jgi:histidine ammonia-lyase